MPRRKVLSTLFQSTAQNFLVASHSTTKTILTPVSNLCYLKRI